MVKNIYKTQKGHIALTLEDETGEIKGIILKNSKIYSKGENTVEDEVIAVIGNVSKDVIFIDKIIRPEIINTKKRTEQQTTKEETEIIFISDIHMGSKFFLENNFNKFIDWLNNNKKAKYLIVSGDLVEGIGIYPDQEKDLEIKNIKKQYKELAEQFKKISSSIKIILSPGNHDATRIAEPQSRIATEFAQELMAMNNILFVENPCFLNIDPLRKKIENHNIEKNLAKGTNILIYHGYSFDYYISNVDSIKKQGGYNGGTQVMKFLLKRGTLAPSFGSVPLYYNSVENMIIPSKEKNIDKTPDIFVSGHLHSASSCKFNGIHIVNASCWQKKTPFQKKMGHEPNPCIAYVYNIKTDTIGEHSFQ